MAVGLPQVAAADHENSDFSPSDCPARLPRGRDRRVLQRVVDPPHDHLLCPYVAYICSPGPGHMIGHAMLGAASFTIYTRTKEFFRDNHLIDNSKLLGCAAVGGIGGAMAGSLISLGSAREFPTNADHPLFSLRAISFRTCQGARPFMTHTCQSLTGSWQVRRQLEYTIAEKKGIKLVKPPSTAAAVRDIFRTSGILGLYSGFYLHFGT